MNGTQPPRAPRPYADPYVAGVALGLVLLAAFVLVGRGLGASGAFASAAAAAVDAVDPAAAQRSPYLAERLGAGAGARALLGDWLVVEVIGVLAGGFASAALAGRLRLTVNRGPALDAGARLAMAALGGIVMGAGAVLARGCTSGQGLTGGALLSVGSWAFVAGAFGAGYAVAPLVRRAWT